MTISINRIQRPPQILPWIRKRLGSDTKFWVDFDQFPEAKVKCTIPNKLRGIDNAFLREAEKLTGWRIVEVTQFISSPNYLLKVVKESISPKIQINDFIVDCQQPRKKYRKPGAALLICNDPQGLNSQANIYYILKRTGCSVSKESGQI